jgi:hypothetical protein
MREPLHEQLHHAEPLVEFEIPEEFFGYLDKMKELAIEKNASDPPSVRGRIYEIPEKYITTDVPNYTQYMVRGNSVNDLVYKLEPFYSDPQTPLSPEQVKTIRGLMEELRKMYTQRDEQGVKLMRTAEDMIKVKNTVQVIIGIIEDSMGIKKTTAVN